MVVGAGCDPGRSPRRAAPTTSPSAAPSPEATATRPQRVLIEARGPARDRLVVAVKDLKTVGLWRELTEHLYRVELDSRLGTANVPGDGHLADAYYTGVLEGGEGGAVCDVMFFPAAVAADLGRWRTYYARGLIAEAPPTMRAFYGSLLAHELAHCRRGARGEAVARAWERRARTAFQRG